MAAATGDDWDMTHLSSGRRIGTISGLDEAEAFKLATLIEDLTDWGALASPYNFADVGPDLLTRLLMLSDLAGGAFLVTGICPCPTRFKAEVTAPCDLTKGEQGSLSGASEILCFGAKRWDSSSEFDRRMRDTKVSHFDLII